MKARICNYLAAGYSGLYIISHEEARVEREIKAATTDSGFSLYAWSITDGITNTADGAATPDTQDPLAMLDAFVQLPQKSVLVLRDFHLFLAEPNPMILRKLRDVLGIAKTSNRVIIILGCQLKMQPELEKEITVMDFALPDRDQLRIVMEGIAESAKIHLNGNTDAILEAASGLTTMEAENAFALSVVEAKDITPAVIAREKAATIKKNGILEIVETKIGMDDIGGLQQLKDWVRTRRNAFTQEARDYGLPMPKGTLVIGIPGTGKSLTAKATANILNVPLLKLDAGRIFGSLVGESERNIRTAIQTAEAVSPCVLWIDEMEKGFSGSKSSGSTDGGTSARVFGSFLQWMQEKTKPVFVVATANDVTALPPELLRKGRFDEQWFVDLPDDAERADIWRIQIGKHGRKPKKFDLAALANATAGWTGAEIEALFNEALFAAFDAGNEPDTALLLSLVKDTVPLSKMMGQQIEALRQWSNGRARKASAPARPVASNRKLAVK